jgi:UDP-N-acetylmuramoylalanine--D-glutamate ligase
MRMAHKAVRGIRAGARTRPASRGRVLPGHVSILGFARSGQSLARALADRGVALRIGDTRPETAFPREKIEKLRAQGARFFFDGPSEDFLEAADWLAVSPGVPPTAPPIAAARSRGILVLAEFEIAWRVAEEQTPGANRWVAVTGTNGKSTTTAWIAEVLRKAGRPVALAGNIGVPLSEFLSRRRPSDFVCEVSSFQLEGVELFHPQVAVLTNVTPDHLDRYADFAEYAAAKERLFRNQTPQDFAVLNAGDPASRPMRTRARRILFSRSTAVPGGVWAEKGWLYSDVGRRRRRVLREDGLALSGAHNLENALAVLAAAECLGAPVEAIREGLTRFTGLPHRTQLVAQARGVQWVDDSKGTNVDATRKSLEGYTPQSVILILGGRDKHGDFPALVGAVARAARRVLTIGEAAGTIEKALSGAVTVERCMTMEKAVERASVLARPSDTVLLSPACASFDQYANFEERGDHFASLARAATESVKRKT